MSPRKTLPLIVALVLTAAAALAQSTVRQIANILNQQVEPQALVDYQLEQYLLRHVPPLVAPASAAQWTAEQRRIRAHLVNDVVFHGWPREWVEAPPRFEDAGTIPTSGGYTLRKLRYQIVPGFFSTALLYSPAALQGRAPAILNVHGHETERGKAADYKQKRCINFARHGIVALSLEWIGTGELAAPENEHDNLAALDLVGANGVGLFYLAMRRGLDYLASLPNVDNARLGVTGLSGGGWQTIVLSSLDERVLAATPVAGYGSLQSDASHPNDTDEVEEDATDFRAGQDYTQLTAMRAPRPTLLVFNAEDDCCFRGPIQKPDLYDGPKAFFALYGKPENLQWHLNANPGTHNYELDNRTQAYRFFSRQFGLREFGDETVSGDDIKTKADLAVGLPAGNLTILGLARQMAGALHRSNSASSADLATITRYKPLTLTQTLRIANSYSRGVESLAYRMAFSDGLGATAIWMKGVATPDNAPATILIADKSKKTLGDAASELVNRGEQVVAADLIFSGDMAPELPGQHTLLVASVGERPLGIEAGQLIALADWVRQRHSAPRVRLQASGIRSQAVALVAAALRPGLFSDLETRGGLPNLAYVLEAPVKYRDAPELFCLDLYRTFDLDALVTLAAPTRITQREVLSRQ